MIIKASTTLQTSSQVLETEVWLSTLHHTRGESHYTLGTKIEYCKHSELFALAPCMWLKQSCNVSRQLHRWVLLESIKMIFSVNPPVQSSDCRQFSHRQMLSGSMWYSRVCLHSGGCGQLQTTCHTSSRTAHQRHLLSLHYLLSGLLVTCMQLKTSGMQLLVLSFHCQQLMYDIMFTTLLYLTL